MADDIQITTSVASGNNPGNSAGASGAGQVSPKNKTENAPTIDLSKVEPTKNNSLDLEAEAMNANQQAAPKAKFVVPDLVKQKFPDLPDLLNKTESMNDEERDYWYQIMPIMTEDQLKKLLDILMNEKTQLKSLDKQYETALNKLNDKHMQEWKEFEAKEKRRAIKDAEAKTEAKEKQDEDALLARLQSI